MAAYGPRIWGSPGEDRRGTAFRLVNFQANRFVEVALWTEADGLVPGAVAPEALRPSRRIKESEREVQG